MPGDFQALLFDVETTLHRLRNEIERLQHLILTDELTGLYNRRYLELRLEEEINRSRRSSRPFSLIFLDLDGFKAVNEQYGHPAGDRLLAEFAEVLRRGARAMDVPVRYGGEEFLLLLPETDLASALEAGERLRLEVSARAFLGGRLTITFSGGVAGFPTDGSDAKALVEQADLALRAAKRWGKDRIVSAAEAASRGRGPWQRPAQPSVDGRVPDAVPVAPGFKEGQAFPACFWHVGQPLVVRALLRQEPGPEPGSDRYLFDTDQGALRFERRGDRWFWLPDGLDA